MSLKSLWSRRGTPPSQSFRDGARSALRRSTRFPGLVLVAGVVLALTLPLIAVFEFQRVTPNPLSQSKNAGAGQAVTITYQYTSSTATASGLGLRVHYDSTRLTFNQVTALFVPPDDEGPLFVIGPTEIPQADTGNEDQDASTDMIILVAWAHTGLAGGGFPGSLNQNLFTIHFTTTAGYTAATRVNVSAIDTAVGFEFQGTSALITPPGAATPTPLPPTPTATPNPTPGGDKAVLDVDASGGDALPFSDGLMILKYLIGARNANLTSGDLVHPNCTVPQCDGAGIGAYIEFIRPQLDVDGNGQVIQFGDGLMILKYIIGARNANLTSGDLVGANCSRCDGATIGPYIDGLMKP